MSNFVIKRNGRQEGVSFDKISIRLDRLKNDVEQFRGEALQVNTTRLAQLTISQMFNGITTSELDKLTAETSAFTLDHPDYAIFAANILVSDLVKNNRAHLPFAAYVDKAYNNIDHKTGEPCALISEELYNIGIKHGHVIDAHLKPDRNYLFDYFGLQTLIKGKYLLAEYKAVRENKVEQWSMVTFETPQHMWMRVALGINGSNLQAAFELYDILSQHQATHATPTLFNAGTQLPQLSSCFLLDMQADSIEGIYDTLKQCALISKFSGGIGLTVAKIRAKNSYIHSTNGHSNGICPMLRVYDATALYVDQGGGKRKGSFAAYIPPFHPDILDYLQLKKNTGADEIRARNLFYALWVSDLFMERVIQEYQAGQEAGSVLWSLFDPQVCPELNLLYGEAFTQRYLELEAQNQYTKQIPIRELWNEICQCQIETGTPYVLFKDHINKKSNQKNLGVIKSSNLCAEIVEYTDPQEVAVCNLASLSLTAMVDQTSEGPVFNFDRLYSVTRIMVRNLNKVIDRNFYPVPEAKHSNLQHRPIGLGIQGLANCFIALRYPFDSLPARKLNRQIAEMMYFAAVTESHALAVVEGPYASIDKNGGAPIRHGQFQFDLWDDVKLDPELKLPWDDLRAKVQRDGVRNSLLIAHMPTASTSQILGNNELFEPFYGNIYKRKTKAGEFFLENRAMVKDLVEAGLWVPEIHPTTGQEYIPLKEDIIAQQGSLQNLKQIPSTLRSLYRTIKDIPLSTLTQMARDRAPFVDQSMSLNVYYENGPDLMLRITQYLTYAWRLGLKTGVYYTRTRQKVDAVDFSSNETTNVVDFSNECENCSA